MRLSSAELMRGRGGSSKQRPVSTSATVLHDAVVYIDGRPMAFAYVERVKSADDRPGRYGYTSTKFGIECISGFGGTRYYAPVGALADMVGTMESKGVHFILFRRELFSNDQ